MKILYTAVYHDETNELETTFEAATFAEAVQNANVYGDVLGESYHLAGIWLETYPYDSLSRTGHIVPEGFVPPSPDITAPEYGT